MVGASRPKYARFDGMLRLALALAAAAAPARAAEPPADLVFVGGAVYTVDAARSWASGVAVRDGRIVYVGDNPGARSLAGPDTEVVDLAGRMLLPAFADSHVHPISGGVELLRCNLSDLETLDALLAKVRECAQAPRQEPWLLGGGWSLPLFADANPHRRLLDEIVSDRPVALWSADGHSLWVNSKALAVAGITKATADPHNGRIEHDASGEPTGTLRERACDLIGAHLPETSAAERIEGLRRAVERAHRVGVTTWLVASADEADLVAYRDLDRSGELDMFVRAALRVDPARDAEQVPELARLRDRGWGPHVVAGAAKLYADGVIESGTAALLEPYLAHPGVPAGGRGVPVWSPDRLRAIALALDAAGFQLHVHAIGDRAVRLTLDAVEAVAREHGPRDRRPVLAHIQLIDPAEIPRFRRLGAAASFQPLWAYDDSYIRELTVPFLGPARARWLYPIGSVARSGAVLASGSDWSVSSMNPLDAIEVALTRRDPTTGSGPGWIPEERADLATLLASYTAGGAWAAFRERAAGSIEVGKSADFVVLERNLFDVAPHEISETKVVATWFEGRLVYRASAAAEPQ